jgi:hypothetical protein
VVAQGVQCSCDLSVRKLSHQVHQQEQVFDLLLCVLEASSQRPRSVRLDELGHMCWHIQTFKLNLTYTVVEGDALGLGARGVEVDRPHFWYSATLAKTTRVDGPQRTT